MVDVDIGSAVGPAAGYLPMSLGHLELASEASATQYYRPGFTNVLSGPELRHQLQMCSFTRWLTSV